MKKLLIITGGSKGIGKATVKNFIDKGWEAINLSRTTCNMEGVTSITTDLSDTDFKNDLEKNIKNSLADRNEICLVHNACVYYSGSTSAENIDNFQMSWNVNVLAPVIINQIVIPFMKYGSSILYIGSTLSEMAVANCLPYVVTKHAILGLMRSTCQDVSQKGIHTSCICPGFTDTETLHAHLEAGGRNVNDIIEKIAIKRLIRPEEIADIIFTCATQPTLNGSVVHANLGSIKN